MNLRDYALSEYTVQQTLDEESQEVNDIANFHKTALLLADVIGQASITGRALLRRGRYAYDTSLQGYMFDNDYYVVHDTGSWFVTMTVVDLDAVPKRINTAADIGRFISENEDLC